MTEGKIVTFYSYKGGAGRTMAMANVAWILASNGKRVLVVDWDLDSPGLHKYFHPFLDPSKLSATPGVINLVNEYVWAATSKENRPGDWHLDYARILDLAVSVNWQFSDGGMLDFVSAGLRNRDYPSLVAAIDWDDFYDKFGGGQFFDALRTEMKANYDYALIDSRTGLSDVADICTMHLPDILVDCFTLSDQSIEGAALIASSVDQRYHDRHIKILPVPMRIDLGEKEKLDAGKALARALLDHFPSGMSEEEANAYWASVEIPYQPFYAFEESLAAFGDTPGSPLTLLASFERLTAAITEGQITALPPMEEATRVQYKDAFTRRRVPPPADIYLSYVAEDRMWADWIAAVLAQAGLRVRRSAAGALAGSNARDEAARAAGAASRTIAVVSPAYLRSPQALGVREAMAIADPAGMTRRLIPVRIGEVRMTEPFAERTVVDLTRRDAQQATEAILLALGRRLAEHPADSVPREPRYPRTTPPVWNVPTRNATFTGRNDVLEKLREQLVGSNTAVVLPLALYGYGGVGKTQVALEYAHRYMADYDIVWWVPSEQPELVSPAFADLASRLSIRVGESFAEAAQAAREALRRGTPYSRWLLIFDNADDPASLESYFPGGSGHVLVTSRNPAWSRVAEPVEIDVFTRQESLEHLQRRVPTLRDQEAMMVAEALGDLPLAIEQAGAWLAETGTPAAEYVEQLTRQSAVVLALSQPIDYPTPVAVTWQLAFDRLHTESPAAARLLELCAYFSPEPISLSLIYSDEMISSLVGLDPRLKERIILGQLIREIAKYSLAKVDRGNNSIQVHRLIQAVIRAQLEAADTWEDTEHEVHRVLVGARPRQGDIDDPENWPRYDWIWPHLGASEAADCDEEETRQLLIDRVRYLWKRGEFEAALAFGRRLEEQWRERLGPDDRQTLYLRFHVANVLRSQGRYAEALAQDSDIHGKQREVLGDEHPHTLQTAGSIAGDLRGLGEFQRALAMDTQTYESFKELFGEDEPSTLRAANNLAIDQRLVGDCFKARELDEDTMGRRVSVLGESHPYTLHSAGMLARDMREAGDFGGSVELLRETYQRYATVLGEDWVDTLRTAKSLAVSLRKVGDVEEAFRITKETSQRYLKNFAPVHPDALACQLNLACDLSALDDKPAAYTIASDVLATYERTLGPKHPFTLAAANNIVTYLRGTGEVEGGLLLAQSTLRSLREVLGDKHPFTLSCAVNLANCLHDMGQFTDAEALERDTIVKLRDTLGDLHPDTLVCQANLATTLRASERAEEAITLQQQVAAGMVRVLGENHPNLNWLLSWTLINRDLEPQPT